MNLQNDDPAPRNPAGGGGAQIELGKSGVKVSPLGLGTWAWGDNLVWGYGKGYGESDLHQAFDETLRAGVNFLDTAEIYGFGKSEKFVGEFQQESPLGELARIATKFFPLPWRLTQRQLLSALRGSLKRLGTRQVDLYQIHWPTPLLPIETLMDALAEAVGQGLTRAVGVSNYNAAQVRRAHKRLAAHGIPLASNQIEYSLLQRDPETNGTIQACRELGVTVIAYSPIKMGVLSGKYTPNAPPRGARGRMLNAAYLHQVEPLIVHLRTLGEKYGRTPAQVALNWAIQRGTLPIPGAKNLRQARENLGALGWMISPGDLALLTDISERVLTSR
jgi:aryl-alcohol dehydrogenase-like predicted oxidoreductase